MNSAMAGVGKPLLQQEVSFEGQWLHARGVLGWALSMAAGAELPSKRTKSGCRKSFLD